MFERLRQFPYCVVLSHSFVMQHSWSFFIPTARDCIGINIWTFAVINSRGPNIRGVYKALRGDNSSDNID